MTGSCDNNRRDQPQNLQIEVFAREFRRILRAELEPLKSQLDRIIDGSQNNTNGEQNNKNIPSEFVDVKQDEVENEQLTEEECENEKKTEKDGEMEKEVHILSNPTFSPILSTVMQDIPRDISFQVDESKNMSLEDPKDVIVDLPCTLPIMNHLKDMKRALSTYSKAIILKGTKFKGVNVTTLIDGDAEKILFFTNNNDDSRSEDEELHIVSTKNEVKKDDNSFEVILGDEHGMNALQKENLDPGDWFWKSLQEKKFPAQKRSKLFPFIPSIDLGTNRSKEGEDDVSTFSIDSSAMPTEPFICAKAHYFREVLIPICILISHFY